MQKEGYVLPSPVVLLTKSKQIAMTTCRDLSQISYKTILDIGGKLKHFLVADTEALLLPCNTFMWTMAQRRTRITMGIVEGGVKKFVVLIIGGNHVQNRQWSKG